MKRVTLEKRKKRKKHCPEVSSHHFQEGIIYTHEDSWPFSLIPHMSLGHDEIISAPRTYDTGHSWNLINKLPNRCGGRAATLSCDLGSLCPVHYKCWPVSLVKVKTWMVEGDGGPCQSLWWSPQIDPGDGPRPFQGWRFCSAAQVSLEACCTDAKGI